MNILPLLELFHEPPSLYEHLSVVNVCEGTQLKVQDLRICGIAMKLNDLLMKYLAIPVQYLEHNNAIELLEHIVLIFDFYTSLPSLKFMYTAAHYCVLPAYQSSGTKQLHHTQ